MPRLNEDTRNRAIGRLEAGECPSSVARHFNVRQSTISRLWQRCRLLKSTRDRPRTGRPRITTQVQDRFTRLLHLRNRTISAAYTANNVTGLRRVSAQTIRNRLRQHGIHQCDHIQRLFCGIIIVVHVRNGAETFDHGPLCTGGGSGLVMSRGSCCITMMVGCVCTDGEINATLDTVFVKSIDTAVKVS
ncbi:uncharacterized protein LOC124288628 [Haliotis rubra]|uniref:uncharacterized protein LOC124288628 n=1 Tax=Haliotis rubra TaxID=36100 RepID=UPI001EE5DC7E|nr:uncharacterized protein LOC124288628 [Haliotis rubra]